MYPTVTYRALRHAGWTASAALTLSRRATDLERRCDAGEIRFSVEWEDDVMAPDFDGDARAESRYWSDIESGRIEVYVISAWTPARCPHCGQRILDTPAPDGPIAEPSELRALGWERRDCISNVDVYAPPGIRDPYVVEIMCDLAAESLAPVA